MAFKRYTKTDITANRFFQMPKFLFQGTLKRKLSNDAKVLYSLLRDRHELSLKNDWVNNRQEVYLIYTREEMADMLGCSQPTLRKAINSLKDSNLMDEEVQGLNRPNLIFLNYISDISELPNDPPHEEKPSPPETPDDSKPETDEKAPKIQIESGVKDSFSPDRIRSEKIFQPGVKESFTQEGKNLSPNDTDLIETDFIDTDLIYLSKDMMDGKCENKEEKKSPLSQPAREETNAELEYNNMMESIKYTIDYDVLINKEYLAEQLDEIVNFMTDILVSKAPTFRVNKEDKPASIVKKQLTQLSAEHIEYVLEQMEKQTTKIKNIRSYLLTALYNAPLTFESYVRQQVAYYENPKN